MKRRFLWCLLCPLLFAPLARAQDEELDGDPEDTEQSNINLGFPDIDDATVAGLVDKLASWSFPQREEAQKEIKALGPGAFRALARAYRDHDDFELRLRIQDIVREQFLWHSLFKHKGFIGIGYNFAQDPRGGGNYVLEITLVQDGTAASDAGLQPGDMIVGVDGGPMKDRPGGDEFRKFVMAKGAGGKVKLDILRAGAVQPVELTLRARPINQYYDKSNPNYTELLEELNAHLRGFANWWSRHFSLPPRRPDRDPSSSVFELPP